MTVRKYFGTDGIRGRVGLSSVNPEFILKLGWAVGRVLAKTGDRSSKVIIGKDTRVSGYMIESALEAGLSAAGVNVSLVGPMPTPAIAYLTQTLHAKAGIVISASHNPFEDNGVKFFSADGSKLPDSIELAIEEEIEKTLVTVESSKLGKAVRINDAPGRYIEFCKSTIPSLTRLDGLKIVVDCANGATYHIAPKVFDELGADVESLFDKPNGFNINEQCGSTHPEALREKVLAVGADVGIALDGDGDRVLMVDARGQYINGDQVLYMIAKDRYEKGLLKGGIVGTLMSNLALEHAINQLGLQFIRAKVGDRYVLEALKQRDWRIGGESSGHIVCLDKTSTGDGIIAALQVLSAMVKKHQTLEELASDFTLYPQILINIKTPDGKALATHSDVVMAVESVTQRLEGKGRVLLRPSGTEPLLRLMIEGNHDHEIKDEAEQLAIQIREINERVIAGLN